jgi:malate permease and related proteins
MISASLTKTISLLILIGIGYLLQKKMGTKENRDGLKTLILNLALPATIFIALLQIDFKTELIIIPILSLGFNLVMHFMVVKLPLQGMFNLPENQYRTLVILIPSLAPGLSCFPFIAEFSGQAPLAMASLADVGNKIFVLIISYTIAMNWYYQINHEVKASKKSKLKDLLLTIVKEPVNIAIVIALSMLGLGLGYGFFPQAITLTIDRLSLIMTPLILIFIGVSIKLTWDQVKTIFSFLFFRSGVAFLLSGITLAIFPVSDLATALLIVVFPQSACSFWPYAHMEAVGKLEKKNRPDSSNRTFDQDFGMNVLACSLPFSVIIIMMVYSTGSLFASPPAIFTSAGVLLALAAIVVIVAQQLAFNLNKKLDLRK